MQPTTKNRHDRIRNIIDNLRADYEQRGYKAPLTQAIQEVAMRGEYSISYLWKIYFK